MPSASASTASKVNRRSLFSPRIASRRSCHSHPSIASIYASSGENGPSIVITHSARIWVHKMRTAPRLRRNDGLLFVAQRGERVYLRRPPRGDEAGEHAGENDDEHRARERPRIGGFHVPQLILDQARGAPRAENSDRHATADQNPAFAQHGA